MDAQWAIQSRGGVSSSAKEEVYLQNLIRPRMRRTWFNAMIGEREYE
jgi:hypothetical protein